MKANTKNTQTNEQKKSEKIQKKDTEREMKKKIVKIPQSLCI